MRSVEEHLEPNWAKAFLRRTRFLESDFQGDVLAVICLCFFLFCCVQFNDYYLYIAMVSTALRTGTPLPQITPCPLLDRFVANQQAFIATRGEREADYNIPQNLTLETLENEQYLCALLFSFRRVLTQTYLFYRCFSVGVATAFGIVSRLDRLMLATKELVGEQYHIHGIVASQTKSNEKMLL